VGTPIILVAVAAAIGVGLVVYGMVRSQQAVGPQAQVRASYRTLADVREQLRRRFDSTGTPAWIASEQRISSLQRDLIANSMKAGQSVAQSLTAVTDNANPPVSDEFALARREIELGASVESALNNMVKRIGSNDLRLMVMVITIQRSVGGDLPAILVTLTDTMRQREEMRAEILAATAQSRATSLIITLLPIVAAVLLYFVVQDYFRPMLVNPLGWVMLAFAGFLLFIGNLIIRRLTAII